ncbi:MAG TPA: UDP-N-acetylmuramoyl-L-alanine--D-glutamate ligase [Thermoanaerobaculia bacterium]|jgi:UDP-N-acetylmuramoylalanine--D-glutamate ligase|nr:UDP-N-acetylmuramoyl-L-alanine--D-glutamate ligase [Thermoanaerobaculia bacterium]
MKVPWSDDEWQRVLVYGMGKSGLAATRLLRARDVAVVAVDARHDVALGDLESDPMIELRLGAETIPLPPGIDGMVLSPGVPVSSPLVREAERRSLPVIAEVELAFPFLDGTVVAITGSNGKSTTATLTAAMLEESGVDAVLCGNIGEPLAAQVDGPPGRSFVVELSSFQLETVRTFRADAAALLNVTPDHMDRYPDFAAYAAAKARIFERQDERSVAVLNADDPETVAIGAGVASARRRWFSLRRPVEDGCYLDSGAVVEASAGRAAELFAVAEVAMVGSHNVENAMAASLLALAAGGDRASLRRVVGRFDGLPHRTRRIRERRGVAWYDDSKGTNVGATLKSLEGFPDRSVHLILGGVGKGQDFAPLREAVARKAKAVYLIGAAAREIELALAGAATAKRSATLERAVAEANAAASGGDVVLLSPACASFDQFTDFTHRGRRFQELVGALDDGERDG